MGEVSRWLNTAIKRRGTIILTVLAAFGALVVWLWPRGPRIPPLLADGVPSGCGQVVLVLSPAAESVDARLWLMERDWRGWSAVRGPIAVTLGHKGLAWGAGEHRVEMPTGFQLKREGDLCSPAGVFRIPFAFGLAPAEQAGWLRLPYTPLTSDIVGVDDPKSRSYNQVVDRKKVEPDWDSDEPMLRRGLLYEWGAFIGHNPDRVPGVGSCIFFHLWTAPGEGTAGCTAMSAEDLRTLLEWLDPAKSPVLVQGLEAW
jgi:L,D-peptidoglycan transpeptidase YkuD (ErfK/YbiS/YcfS/YnhG family)